MNRFSLIVALLYSSYAFSAAKCIGSGNGTPAICLGVKVFVSESNDNVWVARVQKINFSKKELFVSKNEVKVNPNDGTWLSINKLTRHPDCLRDVCLNEKVLFLNEKDSSHTFDSRVTSDRLRIGKILSFNESGNAVLEYRAPNGKILIALRNPRDLVRSVDYIDNSQVQYWSPGSRYSKIISLNEAYQSAKIIFLASNGWALLETSFDSEYDPQKIQYSWFRFAVQQIY